MRVSPEVMELVELLNDEGFGVLAGDLLAEVSLGRELEEAADDGDGSEDKAGANVGEETAIARAPIAEQEQLEAAITFLQLRLVEPVKRIAEAERIAGDLAGAPDPPAASAKEGGKPLRIAFRPLGDGPAVFDRTEEPGEWATAEQLQAALRQLIDPPV